jgi:starch synthase (maltosyl-transferring)
MAKPPAKNSTAARKAASGPRVVSPNANDAGGDMNSAGRIPADGRSRAVIDTVLPSVDQGRFAVKRIAGESCTVEAHCFADGHDRLRVVLRWWRVGLDAVAELEMQSRPNDVWLAEFTPGDPGRYKYQVLAWVDEFDTWRSELTRRVDEADVRVALQVGSQVVDNAARRAGGTDALILGEWSAQLLAAATDTRLTASALKDLALDLSRATVIARYADRGLAVTEHRELIADPKRAAFSSWYELFPRSAGDAGHHGTFQDVERRLGYIADMGFDVLYFPPIHPIGRVNRKGANNALSAGPDDVGSPWAIGSAEGGHKSILPHLGTLEDFRHLLQEARKLGLDIALDIAFQCAPDHPYVREHPQWFKHRPDGSVQFAENPPKKYQDIYPFDFDNDDWRALWLELKSIVTFWISNGVRVFRVDNPHTKPFPFWEWLIAEIKDDHPEVIFLAEAFTRPKVMHRLAKVGFSQSYTYFTWRNSKQELLDYFTELSGGTGREYFRPNVWPNTPDILHETLQTGMRSVFAARLVLAATLSANYGIYGPPFELLQSAPRDGGGEEYRDSEKYQLRHWSLQNADSLYSFIARVNRIRRDNSALQSDASLRFCPIDNDQLIAYVKMDADSGNAILTVVNLDPSRPQSGWVDLDIGRLEIDPEQRYQVHDLLSDQRYLWQGRFNYVLLDPQRAPAHVFRLRRHVRSEQNFEYYL